MRTTNQPDLQLAGIGNAAGGDYHNVKLEGVCKIGGDVNCRTFETSGMTTVHGSIRAEEKFSLGGKMTCHGGLSGGEVRLEGHMTVEGPLQAEQLELNGYMRVKGHSQVKNCKMRGALIVDGWLAGEGFEIMLEGPFHAEGVKAERLTVKHSGKGSLRRMIEAWLPDNWQAQARVRVIEADIVDIEETMAETVRGRTIMIGPGCNIDRVEYVSELHVHPQAQVRERYQIQG